MQFVLLFMMMLTVLSATSAQENTGTHLITITNKLDHASVEIEVYQGNLQASVNKPVIKEKGAIALEAIPNYVIKIAPGDSANIEVRAKGERTRGHFIANVRPDIQVTLYAYELKDPTTRTALSERYPGICNQGKPGDGDENVEITPSRTNEGGLSCRPQKSASEKLSSGA